MYPLYQEDEKIKLTEKMVEMRDGVRLYTRTAVPSGVKKCPVVFIRTPYEEAHDGKPHCIEAYHTDRFTENGYAVVLQHCRGTGDSEGICIPYNEKEDGLDTLDHIRRQDFYDGEIYPVGGSYLSTVHLSYLSEQPADVKGAVLNIQTDRMYFRNYRNGCNYDFCNLRWWLGMMKRQYPQPKLEGNIKRPYKDLMKRIVGEDVPQYTESLLNDTYNGFWKKDPRDGVVESLQIPVLFTEGWFDFYIEGMFSMWERLPEETKKKSAFIVGPWGHGNVPTGREEYPLENARIPDDYDVQWFDSIRNGKPYPCAVQGKVNYYSVGAGTWKEAQWPVASPKVFRRYLNIQGRLTAESCAQDCVLSYCYDPEKRTECFPYHSIYKAKKPGTTEGVLSFVSEEITETMEHYGQIGVHLTVSSDCADTAFFVRVYMMEEGESYNLTETITALSYFYPDYEPNETVSLELCTPPIAFTLKKGCRIRLDVASDGGIYVPHANVKGHWAEVEECKTARNSVLLKDSYVEF